LCEYTNPIDCQTKYDPHSVGTAVWSVAEVAGVDEEDEEEDESDPRSAATREVFSIARRNESTDKLDTMRQKRIVRGLQT